MSRLVQICLLACVVVSSLPVKAVDWFQRQTVWHGFPQFHLKVNDRAAWLVVPETAATGQPWVWRARFPGYHDEVDIELVRRGFHLAYVDVAGFYGAPRAIQIGDAFYRMLTEERKLNARPVMEGVSRGGLFVYNWIIGHPDRVACIYCDTPVLDFRSWPGGRGSGRGSDADWTRCLQIYGLTDKSAGSWKRSPVDLAPAIIAEHRIPVLHIVSGNDVIVPPAENTHLLQSRLHSLESAMELISVSEGTEKSGGHHFTHPDPMRVVQFIRRHVDP